MRAIERLYVSAQPGRRSCVREEAGGGAPVPAPVVLPLLAPPPPRTYGGACSVGLGSCVGSGSGGSDERATASGDVGEPGVDGDAIAPGPHGPFAHARLSGLVSTCDGM